MAGKHTGRRSAKWQRPGREDRALARRRTREQFRQFLAKHPDVTVFGKV